MALARLGGVAILVPSVDWLLYSAIRKEALLTSQIEGTQATLTDLFDDEGRPGAGQHGRCRVTSYLRAFRLVRDNLRSGPACRSRCACCATPPPAARWRTWRGSKQPESCGARRTGSAARGPAGPRSCRRHRKRLPPLLADLERFIHDPRPALPRARAWPLVHVQFETTIHPFLDGNGRIGRLLIAALLEQWGLLPLVYLSGYLKQHQAEYYRRRCRPCVPKVIGKAGSASSSMAWRPRPRTLSAASSRWRT